MSRAPTFDEIFAVMSVASVGDAAARVALPDDPQFDDTATRLAIALNLLLEDLELRAAESKRAAALELRQQVIERSNQAKSAFLANMSHELRTPLNAILGFADLLLEQEVTDRQRRYLNNIRDAGGHLLELINDTLDLSKVEAGKMELRRESIELQALLQPLIEATQVATKQRGLTFEVRAPASQFIRVDATRTRQILHNLLSNSVKFTPGGGRVTLDARVSGDELTFEVIDTGVGIPIDRQDRVFGTFERLHEDIAETTGTGLGLALTKRLVELHGGTIDFTSAEGTGTTFRVRLPGAAHTPISGQRLLVVEDDQLDADLIVTLADSQGLRSEVVASVAEALSALRRELPIGVILDLRLPDGRGEQVLEALPMASKKRIPVLVVTVEDDEGPARLLGAEDHVTKPIDSGRLSKWFQKLAREIGVG